MKSLHNLLVSLVVTALALAVGVANPATAEDVVPSYKASPDVYKLLAENDQFRVILQTSKPGQRDEWHSHLAAAVYRVSDCTARIHLPGGTTRPERVRKSGTATLQRAVASHSFENTGKTDCVAVIVERK